MTHVHDSIEFSTIPTHLLMFSIFGVRTPDSMTYPPSSSLILLFFLIFFDRHFTSITNIRSSAQNRALTAITNRFKPIFNEFQLESQPLDMSFNNCYHYLKNIYYKLFSKFKSYAKQSLTLMEIFEFSE